MLTGRDPNFANQVAQFPEVTGNQGASSGLFANTAPGSSGNGGSILIDPRVILVQDGARISVDSQGFGAGGNIELQAGRLILDNQGKISAETASNQGGNITLNVDDYIVLRRGSQISTTAGTAQAGGDGGNLFINTKFVVANKAENSDITANACNYSGKICSVLIERESLGYCWK